MGFRAQHDCGRRPQVRRGIELSTIHACRENRNLSRAQPVDDFLGRCGANWDGKDRAEAGSNGIRVVKVRQLIGDDDGRNSGSVGASNHRPKIARLFDAFNDGQQRLVRQHQVRQAEVRWNGHCD